MREFANPLISRLRRKSALTGHIAALIWVGQWPVWAVCDLGPWAIRQMLRRIRGRQRAQSARCCDMREWLLLNGYLTRLCCD
ncbi:MAG: hypothetical protein ABJO67_15465 [Pseudoruegeria sp.]